MKLKAALLQTDPVWESVDENLTAARAMVDAADASLVVLPEMFATGFSMNAAKIAERSGGTIAEWMRETSASSGKAIAGSVAVADTEKGIASYRNRFYFATPDGTVRHYDKRHLFRMSGEHNVYSAGDRRLIVEWEGFRIMPIVCYDLRFPVWCRNRGDYDVILCVASWATARRDVWLTLLKARALENLCFTLGVNRVGDDPDAHYSGDSIACDYKGRIVVAATGESTQIVTAELDRDKLEEFRRKFPVYLDADDFELIY